MLAATPPKPRFHSNNATAQGLGSPKLHLCNNQHRLSRREIQLRVAQIEKGWSEQERADRLNAGFSSRAWLSKLINQSQFNRIESQCYV
jgi:hypothetical protein